MGNTAKDYVVRVETRKGDITLWKIKKYWKIMHVIENFSFAAIWIKLYYIHWNNSWSSPTSLALSFTPSLYFGIDIIFNSRKYFEAQFMIALCYDSAFASILYVSFRVVFFLLAFENKISGNTSSGWIDRAYKTAFDVTMMYVVPDKKESNEQKVYRW